MSNSSRLAQVVIIRPYQKTIRARVRACLERAGLTWTHHVVAPGTPDIDAFSFLRLHTDKVLLIPFHAHHDAAGNRINGVSLLEMIFARGTTFTDIPILMPASGAGLAAARLLLSRVDNAQRNRVMVLPEDQLDDADLPDMIRKHCQDFGVLF